MKTRETIAFRMDDEYLEVIDRQMFKSDIFSRKQYFEYALALFGWAIEASNNGRIIASVDTEKDTYREISMSPLDRVRLMVDKEIANR